MVTETCNILYLQEFKLTYMILLLQKDFCTHKKNIKGVYMKTRVNVRPLPHETFHDDLRNARMAFWIV